MQRVQGFGLAAALLALGSTPAAAAAGDMPPLVRDIGIALLLSGVLGVLFARVQLPTIAAFVFAGVVAGPLGLGLVTDPSNIDTIAQLGFVLLLFMIGLEINFAKMLAAGRSIILSGVLQFPLTALFGFAAVKVLALLGAGGGLIEGDLAALYVGVIIAGSSTLLVIKLYQDALELDTVPGRIAIGMLVFQDLWAIVALLLQPSLRSPQVGAIIGSFAGIALLAAIAVLLGRTVVASAFHRAAKVPEVMLIGAVSWCFAVVLLGTSFDGIAQLALGADLHLAVGPGIAALIAGATIANLPYATEIETKVGVVKDFFVTLFFVGLGMAIPQPSGVAVLVLSVGIAVVAMLARLIVFFPLFYWTGIDQRNAMVSSLRLAQISEFGLVIAFLGTELGHITPELASTIIFAFVLTALTTAPLFGTAYRLHAALAPALAGLGFREPAARAEGEAKKSYRLALLGFHRVASSLLHDIARHEPALAADTIVIDFNAAIHPRIRAAGARVEYGDLSNPETLLHAGVDRARVVVSTVPDDLMRGIDNRRLVQSVRKINPSAIIIANAVSFRDCAAIYAAGADYVYLPRVETAHALNEAIRHALNGTLPDMRTARQESDGSPDARDEVLP